MEKIAIIDDSHHFLEQTKQSLNNFEIRAFSCPNTFLNYFQENSKLDGILIDLKMPQHDGFSLFRQIQTLKDNIPPCFIISETNSSQYRVSALKIGFDDYFHKKMSWEEISLRIKKALISRSDLIQSLYFQGLSIFPNLDCQLNGQNLKITKKEFIILKSLISSQNHYIPRKVLMKLIWKNKTISPKTLNSHICNLNIKLISWEYSIKVTKNSNVTLGLK
ncbi:MAG: response regulator transcription factor [Bacteriovoracaceae bacterium]|jgi:DNA-binding response OmpR family regulator|nr:response regulator transcription factor [Bacteriovoracaceae bacterium]